MSNKVMPDTKTAQEYQATKADSKVRFLRYREGAEIYGMGRSSFERLAKAAGAVYKVGKMSLVKVEMATGFKVNGFIDQGQHYYGKK